MGLPSLVSSRVRKYEVIWFKQCRLHSELVAKRMRCNLPGVGGSLKSRYALAGIEYSQSQYPVPYRLLEISWFDNYFLFSAVSSREISHYSCRAAASYRSIPARSSSAGYQLSRDFGKGVYSWKQTLNYFR